MFESLRTCKRAHILSNLALRHSMFNVNIEKMDSVLGICEIKASISRYSDVE